MKRVRCILYSSDKLLSMSASHEPAVYVGGTVLRAKDNAAYHATSGICFEPKFPDARLTFSFPECRS
jgi:hypothetical protein